MVKVTKSLRSASLTISLSCSHLRPKAMRVSVSAGRSGREGCVPAAQSRRMPERTLGLLLTSEGWWVGLGSKAAHEAQGRNTLKPVADEAGRGYTCGTSRGAGATYALNRAPAQPAPRSTCTASPYTPPPASRTQRHGVGAGCGRAAGQVSWPRVGSVGRFDRLWHTDGRPFVRGAHQRLWQLGR